jgi:hypothetical protein
MMMCRPGYKPEAWLKLYEHKDPSSTRRLLQLVFGSYLLAMKRFGMEQASPLLIATKITRGLTRQANRKLHYSMGSDPILLCKASSYRSHLWGLEGVTSTMMLNCRHR